MKRRPDHRFLSGETQPEWSLNATILQYAKNTISGASGRRTCRRKRRSRFLRLSADIVPVVQGVILGPMRSRFGYLAHRRQERVFFGGHLERFNFHSRALRQDDARGQLHHAVFHFACIAQDTCNMPQRRADCNDVFIVWTFPRIVFRSDGCIAGRSLSGGVPQETDHRPCYLRARDRPGSITKGGLRLRKNRNAPSGHRSPSLGLGVVRSQAPPPNGAHCPCSFRHATEVAKVFDRQIASSGSRFCFITRKTRSAAWLCPVESPCPRQLLNVETSTQWLPSLGDWGNPRSNPSQRLVFFTSDGTDGWG